MRRRAAGSGRRAVATASRGRRALVAAAVVTSAALGCAAVPAAASTGTGRAVASQDWPSYLNGPAHSSYNAPDTAITPANARLLVKKWHFKGPAATIPGQPGPSLYASPVVAGGAVFIGDNSGWFYKLDEATGTVLAKVFIGFQPKLTCEARGFVATATVAADPSDGQDTVYVGGADGYLYALRETDLSLKWRSVIDLPSATVSDYFQWSSPTVANGRIYVGSASHCDKPLTRGAVVGFDQATGTEFARFYTVPAGVLGGGVWSSVAVDAAGNVYATTGTQPAGTTQRYYSVSIVKLDGTTLQPLAWFTVPGSQLKGDGDFGASPTLFTATINGAATPMVAACNKNGILYALDTATMNVVWERQVGAKSSAANPSQCSAAAIYDGTYLYVAGDATTIHGVAYRGSLQRVDPVTGRLLWQVGLPNGVIGTPTMNGGGIIGVGTYGFTATPNAIYLVNAASGKILKTVSSGSFDFAQPAFANGWVFTANVGNGLTAWGQ